MAHRTRSTRPRTARTAIQALSVALDDCERREFEAWIRRASVAGGPPEAFLKYASWYGAVRDRWFDLAQAQGLWEPGRDPGRPAKGYCRQAAEAFGHAERADGLVIHFLVKTEFEPPRLQAKVCRDPSPFRMITKWKDQQRLTWEEFTHGEKCRGCGQGFVGAPEWKPVLQRTPEDAELIEREETAFRALHPDCASMTWRYGSNGVTHCCECCPPPPLSPEQTRNLARIAVDIVLRIEAQEAELESHWRASAVSPARVESARTIPNC
jgi:hypothetical protein